MNENDNIQHSDFSDIPALGDTQGLENYLNNEALANQGLPTSQPNTADNSATGTADASAGQAPAASNTGAADTITLTKEQLNAILASRGQAAPVQTRVPQPNTPPVQNPVYSAQEQTFIAKALAQGYSLTQINDFLARQNGAQNRNPVLEQRLNQVEQYLRTQEYKAAENAFVSKLSDFGTKWGLSEQDLVTFGNAALSQGINIAMDNINLETVFRAIYPEQYAIRSRRMAPTSTSQIYGGTSFPEGSRANASKLEDAYVEAFLKGAMPNQYAASKK